MEWLALLLVCLVFSFLYSVRKRSTSEMDLGAVDASKRVDADSSLTYEASSESARKPSSLSLASADVPSLSVPPNSSTDTELIFDGSLAPSSVSVDSSVPSTAPVTSSQTLTPTEVSGSFLGSQTGSVTGKSSSVRSSCAASETHSNASFTSASSATRLDPRSCDSFLDGQEMIMDTTSQVKSQTSVKKTLDSTSVASSRSSSEFTDSSTLVEDVPRSSDLTQLQLRSFSSRKNMSSTSTVLRSSDYTPFSEQSIASFSVPTAPASSTRTAIVAPSELLTSKTEMSGSLATVPDARTDFATVSAISLPSVRDRASVGTDSEPAIARASGVGSERPLCGDGTEVEVPGVRGLEASQLASQDEDGVAVEPPKGPVVGSRSEARRERRARRSARREAKGWSTDGRHRPPTGSEGNAGRKRNHRPGHRNPASERPKPDAATVDVAQTSYVS